MLYMANNCGGSAHLGGGLSSVELLATLYGAVLRYDAGSPRWAGRDRFIMSKGHGVLSYYAALCEAGFFSKELLDTFQQNETDLGAHPVMNMELGMEASNGSLGQGLSLGVGIALSAKLNKQDFRVFVLLGNGECNEGAVWEAAMSAAQYELTNLVIIVDNNEMQSDGDSKNIIGMGSLVDKFNSFGWAASSVDGHSIPSIYDALTNLSADKPTAVIASTIKGKGVSFMENRPEWHHNRLSRTLYENAMAELELH
jgi:transketolase